jgi:hypothetical protein
VKKFRPYSPTLPLVTPPPQAPSGYIRPELRVD